MEPAPVEPEVGAFPVTTIITRRVRVGSEKSFETWLHGISEAAARFPGHGSVTILRPRSGDRTYTIILQFDVEKNLRAWLDSDVRRGWVERSKPLTEGEEQKDLVTGLEHWFTPPGERETHGPPEWKMVLLTILAVFPTINVLEFLLGPVLQRVHHVVGVLIITVCLTLLLSYVLMPTLTKLAYKWLYPRETR